MPQIDAVIDHWNKIVYIDNVKAGSSNLRTLMDTTLNASWEKSGCCMTPEKGQTPSGDAAELRAWNRGCNTMNWRSSTGCLGSEHMDYFAFSFVRHPVSKFESGVRQAWSRNAGLAKLNADQILEKQLSQQLDEDAPWSFWLDEHLESNDYRLTGYRGAWEGTGFLQELRGRSEHGKSWPAVWRTKPVRLNFVGQLENFVADLRKAANLYDATTASSTPCAAAQRSKAAGGPNATSAGKPRCGMRVLLEEVLKNGAEVAANGRERVSKSQLSKQSITRLCASEELAATKTSSEALAAALKKYDCAHPEASRSFFSEHVHLDS